MDWAKAFDSVNHRKLWKILKEMGIPEHLRWSVCRSGSNRARHGKTGWFQIGIGVHQGCILSPCLLNLHAEYIMWNARLNEAQAGIKIPGRNINNLRYANDTTRMAESEEELKSLLMRMKEKSEKSGLKFNTQKTKSVICHFMANRWGDNGNSERLYLHSLLNHCRSWLLPWN